MALNTQSRHATITRLACAKKLRELPAANRGLPGGHVDSREDSLGSARAWFARPSRRPHAHRTPARHDARTDTTVCVTHSSVHRHC
eukprot:COSAG03_NODE_39_length_17408_cov_16.363972_14_plen_86_part_00